MKNQISIYLRSVLCTSIGVASIALVFYSCGGSTGPYQASIYNNPGTGTSTLLVTADITANNNANAIGGFSIDYNVVVQDSMKNPIDSAIVTIQNAGVGPLVLPETRLPNGGNRGSGTYRLNGAVFPNGDFQLDVVKGANNIHGVVLGGPMLFSILFPLQNDTLPADSAVTVRWSVPVTAKSAIVETRDFGPQTVADSGAFQILGTDNPARGNQRVRVTRSNDVDIAGGLAGSRMRVNMRITVEPILVR